MRMVKAPASSSNSEQDPHAVKGLLARARRAQQDYESYQQDGVDEVVTAVAWAIVHPERNRELSELAVADTGLGNVADKMIKNRRKTMGLLRDLRAARSVGIIREVPEQGIVEIARPVGVVAAVTPSTNPAATAVNMIMNALKGRNAIILSPSPKGHSTAQRLLEFIHAELDRVAAPPNLVQMLRAPVSKESTAALMRAADLVVVTGSQNNVRAAYASGTPAIGVGVGNVPVIVDTSAELRHAADCIAASKTFDYATSCSSENSLIVLESIYNEMVDALRALGGAMLDDVEKRALQTALWLDGKLNPRCIAQSAATISRVAGLKRADLHSARFLMVEEEGVGDDYPFSGEKLSPVLSVYRAHNFDHAFDIARGILAYQGAGHSVGIHSRDEAQIRRLGLELPVCRVIVNQAHAFATGGSFDNGLPFSLSMGCGTWGRNNISDNLNHRHYINITRIVRTIPAREPSEGELFDAYRKKYGI